MSNARYPLADRGRRSAPAGSRSAPVFQRQTSAGKAPHRVKVGETDLYAKIQSFAAECDVNKIVERYQAGDTAILSRVQGVYTDVSGVPSDLTSAFETVRQAREYYEALPDSVHAEFPSLGDFLGAVRVGPADYKPDKPDKPDKHKPDKEDNA